MQPMLLACARQLIEQIRYAFGSVSKPSLYFFSLFLRGRICYRVNCPLKTYGGSVKLYFLINMKYIFLSA